MASYIGSGLVVSSTASLSAYSTGTNGGSNYTVGSGPGRGIFIFVHGYLDASANTAGCSSVTHNGEAATAIAALPKNSRTWIEIWYVKNPTAGSGGTTINTVSLQRALRAHIVEVNDMDQTTPVHATLSSYNAASGTTRQFSLTTHAANSLLLAGVSVQAGAGTFSASDGGTLVQSGQTGTAGTNDVSGGVAYEAIASAQAETLSITWTNSDNNVGIMIEVLSSSGSVGDSSGSSTPSAVGQATTQTDGSSSGVGSATSSGQSTIQSVGSSLGSSTVSGSALVGSVGSSLGAGSALAVGRSIFSGVGSLAGVSAGAATGRATVQSIGSSNGVGLAGATSGSSSSGSSSGSSSVSASGQASARSAGLAPSTSNVTGSGRSSIQSSGSSQSTSSVLSVGRAIVQVNGLSFGIGSQTGVGQTQSQMVGISVGGSTVLGIAFTPPARRRLAGDPSNELSVITPANDLSVVNRTRTL